MLHHGLRGYRKAGRRSTSTVSQHQHQKEQEKERPEDTGTAAPIFIQQSSPRGGPGGERSIGGTGSDEAKSEMISRSAVIRVVKRTRLVLVGGRASPRQAIKVLVFAAAIRVLGRLSTSERAGNRPPACDSTSPDDSMVLRLS